MIIVALFCQFQYYNTSIVHFIVTFFAMLAILINVHEQVLN